VNVREWIFKQLWYISKQGGSFYLQVLFKMEIHRKRTDQSAIFRFLEIQPLILNIEHYCRWKYWRFFINGVAFLIPRWSKLGTQHKALCGGPGNAPCPEDHCQRRLGTEMSVRLKWLVLIVLKGHPCQWELSPSSESSAFKLDFDVVSSICNLYDAKWNCNVIEAQHSPTN